MKKEGAMKNFSLPRFAVILWFFWYTAVAVIGCFAGTGRHAIYGFIFFSAMLTLAALIGLGKIEDSFD